VTVHLPIIVIDNMSVECLFGAHEIIEEKVDIFLQFGLLVFFETSPSVPLTLKGFDHDPDEKMTQVVKMYTEGVRMRPDTAKMQRKANISPGVVNSAFSIVDFVRKGYRDESFDDDYDSSIYEKYSDLFLEDKVGCYKAHMFDLNLKEGSAETILATKQFSYSRNIYDEADPIIKKMLSQGLITETKKSWHYANMVLVKNIDDNFDICVDWNRLNGVIKEELVILLASEQKIIVG